MSLQLLTSKCLEQFAIELPVGSHRERVDKDVLAWHHVVRQGVADEARERAPARQVNMLSSQRLV